MDPYDAITIGSGLGGLGAAAVLARAGQRVLLLERNAECGGAATVYRHGRLAIEASLHEIDALGLHHPHHGLLHRLGVAEQVKLVRIPELYEVRSALLARPFSLPDNLEGATEAAVATFPGHAQGVRRFFRSLHGVSRSFSALADGNEHRVSELLGAAVAGDLWQLLHRARWSTLRALEDFFGDDPVPKLALAANLGYLHDDPAELWFPLYALMQGAYLRDGGHYLAGGSRALTDSLLNVIRQHGGEVIADARASVIELDARGRVAGVRWVDATGRERSAQSRVVLGNAAPTLLGAMLPGDAGARLLAAYADMTPSISLFTVSLGVSRLPREFGVSAYSTFVLPDWMTRLEHMTLNGSLLGADPAARLPSYALVDYSRIDTGLNAQGLHLLSLTGTDRIVNWSGLNAEQTHERKQRWIAALIADLNRHYPGIAASVEHSEMSNAATMQQYLGTPGGSVYGFAPTVARFSRPPSADTEVPGLFLASAYTSSGGFEGALGGGLMAAHAAQDYLDAAAPGVARSKWEFSELG